MIISQTILSLIPDRGIGVKQERRSRSSSPRASEGVLFRGEGESSFRRITLRQSGLKMGKARTYPI